MTWIHHNGDLFNLNNFSYICCVGNYEISLSKCSSADDDEYFVLAYPSEEDRDEALQTIKTIVFSRNI